MVVFDATILLPILWPDVPAPIDAATNKPVERFRERIDYLVRRLEEDRSKIIIPTPVLSEILVRSGSAGPEYLSRIKSFAVLRIVPFDERAAVEVAAMTREAINGGDKRGRGEGQPSPRATTCSGFELPRDAFIEPIVQFPHGALVRMPREQLFQRRIELGPSRAFGTQ